MKPEKVFKRYDIRGDYPEEVNEEFARKLGKALGTFASRNYADTVVVGRDNKESSAELKRSFIEGVNSVGVDILDAGTGTTDYVALTGRKNNVVSVQVTSSHLPLDTNGFKFMYPEGNGFLNPDLYTVQDFFRNEDFETGEGGVEDVSEESRREYIEDMKEFFHRFFDSIDKKVVVDTLGGAATQFTPRLLEELGAEVVDISAEKGAEHPYVDPPNPKPENLAHIEERVEEEDADLAVANDMDADRVAVYSGEEWISGNELFALLSLTIDSDSDVVASIDTSQMLEDVVGQGNGEVHYTRVGDPFVIDKALEVNAELAGEPNQHYCFPEFVPYNSGTLGALLFSAMDLDKNLEQLPDYHTRRINVELENNDVKAERMEKVLKRVRQGYRIVSELDGVKFHIGEATVLARPSSRSPVIRIAVEARNEEALEEAVSEAEQIVRNP